MKLRRLALLVTLALSASALALLFRFLHAQAQADTPHPYTFDATLVVNARDYYYPAITYTLQITAPNDWDGWDVFWSFPPGTQPFTESLDLFFDRLGVYYNPYATPAGQVAGPVPSSQPGLRTLRYKHAEHLRSLSQGFALHSPFQAWLERDQLVIHFLPASIPPVFNLHAYLLLLGVEVNHSDLPQHGLYNDLTWSGDNPQAAITWDYLPGVERPGDSLRVVLPRKQFTCLSLGDCDLFSTHPVTVTTRLAVDARGVRSDYPSLTSTMQIQASPEWPFLSGLRLFRQDQPEYRDSLKSFLNSLGVTDDQVLNELFATLRWPPEFKFDQRDALLVLRSVQDTLYLTSSQTPFKDPLGRFSTRVEGRQMLMELGKDYLPFYPWVSWVVELKIDGLQVLSANPMPASDDGAGGLTWVFPAGSKPEDISIITSLPTLLYLQSISFGNFAWYWAFSTVNFLLRSIFVLVLFGVLSSPLLPKDASTAVVRRVRRILFWSLVILLAVQLVSVSDYPFYLLINKLKALPFWIYRLPDIFLPIALVVFIGYAAIEARRTHLVNWIFLALVGLSLVIFLPFSYMYFNSPDEILQYTTSRVLAIIPLHILLLFVFTAFILVGIVYLFLALLPERTLAGFDLRERLSQRKFWAWLLVIALAILAQSLYLTTFAPQAGPTFTSLSSLIQRVLGDQPLTPDEAGLAWTIVQRLQYYTTGFAYQLADLLPIFALVGVACLIYLYGSGANSAIFAPDQGWIKLLACLLFAGFIVTRNFNLVGVLIPIGFLAGWFILPRLLNGKLESSLKWIESHNPSPTDSAASVITCHRREFITRAKAIEDLENQFGDLHADYSKNKIDLETYESRRAGLETEIEWLKSGAQHGGDISPVAHVDPQAPPEGEPQTPIITVKLKPQSLLRLPQGLSPKDLALSLGPGDNWWKNGLLAARIGAILTILPVSYYLYVLVTARLRDLLATHPFGLFDIFQGLVSEVAFWLVAAFVMGLLYPYLWGRNGAIKGAFLTLVYAIGMGLVALAQALFSQAGSASWLFRLLQLLLYLVALGVLMDWTTLKEHHIYWKQLLDHYNLQDTRILVGYLSPLALALLGLAQQILSGAASQSIVTEIIKGVTQALPNIP